jgi:hypothetical protein
MAKRKRTLVIKDHATGYSKSRAKGRSGKGGKIDLKYRSLGKHRGRKR